LQHIAAKSTKNLESGVGLPLNQIVVVQELASKATAAEVAARCCIRRAAALAGLELEL
jgi:hypothetical protein